MITAHYNQDGTIGFIPASAKGWWNDYPRLALYIAAGIAENSGPSMVPEVLMASDAEAQAAEDSLMDYPIGLIYDMGYQDLVPAGTPEDTEWLAHEIAGRYY